MAGITAEASQILERAAEIERRVDDLRSGKARLIPDEEVRSRAAAAFVLAAEAA